MKRSEQVQSQWAYAGILPLSFKIVTPPFVGRPVIRIVT